MRVGVDARHLTAARGVARYTRELLRALAAASPDDEWRALVPGRGPVPAVPDGVELVRHPLPGRALFAAAAVARRPRLDRLLGDVDVVWVPAPAPLALSSAVPLVLTVHDRSFEARPGDFTPYERLWHRLARPRALAERADAVVCVSEAVREELARAWGVRATVVAPAPLSARAPAAPAAGSVPRVPRSSAAPDAAAPARPAGPNPAAPARPAAPNAAVPAAPYLLFVGALEPRKGPDVLAAAYARARADGLRADLVVVGDGRMAIEGPGVRRLPGGTGDGTLAALYAGALAVVAPSWLEGFGLPPVEAAALGTPSIVSDLPVFAETLGDGALRVPPGDVAALADALARIERDATLRMELRAVAKDAVARYSWERSAHLLHATLTRVAAGGGRQP